MSYNVYDEVKKKDSVANQKKMHSKFLSYG